MLFVMIKNSLFHPVSADTVITFSIEATHVIQLTESNITKFRNAYPLFMLLFSVDWCTHCIDLWPEYELAAKALGKLKYPIPLAKVDGLTENELVIKYDIDHYPTILVLNGELVHKYRGGSKAIDMIDYMEKESNRYYKFVNSMRELEELRGADDVILLALAKSMEQPELFKVHRALFTTSDNFKALVTTSDELKEHFGATNSDFTALLLKPSRFMTPSIPWSVNVTKYFTNDSLSEVEIGHGISESQPPLIGLYNGATRGMYGRMKDELLCVIPFDMSLKKEPTKAVTKFGKQVANSLGKVFGDTIRWVIVDSVEHQDYIEQYLDPSSFEDILVGCKIRSNKYQLYGDSLNMADVRLFATQTLIKLELKSDQT